MDTPSSNEPQLDEELVTTLSSPALLNNYSLVLSAADITHRIKYLSSRNIEIYVTKQQVEKAKYEIDAYIRENKNWPERSSHEDDGFTPTFKAMSLIISGILIYIYGVTGDWQNGSEWFTVGAGDSTAILTQNQFFRLITPLTLHADIVHLLSNCVFGTFLIHFFLGITGNGIGLLAILTTSTVANLINVLVRGPEHLFVGFSTAVFSVIGMLCTINFVGKTGRLGLTFFMPVMAGLALLAFLGSSGERTDLGAHLFGLLCGLISGNFIRLPLYKQVRGSFTAQTFLSVLTFLLAIICWFWAFKA